MMNNLIFLDTESTSVLNTARLVQLAFKQVGEQAKVLYFQPAEPITYGAMAVHHITEKMVEKCDVITKETADFYTDFFKDKIIVCHNLAFDQRVLKNEGIEIDRNICTLKIARKIFPRAEMHKLQYLRYSMGIEIEAQAHDAEGDIIVLEQVFMHLMAEVRKLHPDYSDEKIIESMLSVSKKPTLLTMFYFGKYRGKAMQDVIKTDPGYITWMLNQKTLDEEVRYSLNYWMKQ